MDKALFEKGLEIRKAVVGEEYVNKSLENANSFNMPFQELVTSYCWGHVWGRDGISRPTRSMLNIAMLCALNRPHELKIHLRGAVNNGVTPAEIQEVLLQVAIYCGVPAALEGFKIATEVLTEMGVEIPKE